MFHRLKLIRRYRDYKKSLEKLNNLYNDYSISETQYDKKALDLQIRLNELELILKEVYHYEI